MSLSPVFHHSPRYIPEEPVDTDQWEKMAQELPADDYHHRMRSIRLLARNILNQIEELHLNRVAKAQLQQQALQFIEQLERSAETFCQSQNQFHQEQADIDRSFAEIDGKFDRFYPSRPIFMPPEEALPLWSRVQQRLEVHSPEVIDRPLSIMSRWEDGGLLGTAICNAEKSDMQDVAIVANVLESANEAVLWGAKKICGLHPAIGQACSQGKELVLEGVQKVSEHMPDFVKTTASQLSAMRKEALQISALQAQQRCGISKEETKRHYDNLATIGVESLSFLGGVGAGKALAFTGKVLPRIPKPLPLHLQESLADTLLRSDVDSLLKNIPSVSAQSLQELAQQVNPRVAREHLTYYKEGHNFVVRVGKGEHSVVIKAADDYTSLYEFHGSQFFSTLKLKNIHFTPPIHVVKENNRVILIKPYAVGKTLHSWIDQYAQGKVPFETVTEVMQHLGKAYNELQEVSKRYGVLPSQHQKGFLPDSLIYSLNDANLALRELKQPLISLTDAQITAFSREWQRSPVLAGFELGDVGLHNFVYSKTNKNLVYIDGESLVHGINRMGQPVGVLEHDLARLTTDLLDVSISNGMSAQDAHYLLGHFLHQLHTPVHPLPILAGKIDAVKQILDGITVGQKPDLKEVGKLVEQINEYINLMQW